MATEKSFDFCNRKIGPEEPVYFIAEMSANHNGDFDRAVDIIREAKKSGADAIKLQTYTPDTLTLDSNKDYFQIESGTEWDGQTLYELYEQAQTPWEWQEDLKEVAEEVGLDFFSTAFDPSSVEFLEKLDVPVHKVASFEIVDLPLIEKMGQTGKPVIISTGVARLSEIDEAVRTAREAGASEVILLKCTSSYPASPEDMNLRVIPNMAETFDVPVGLSDHSLGSAAPITATTLGACVIEKHFTLSRQDGGPDSAFSMEPREFKQMVEAVWESRKALGEVDYQLTESEENSRVFSRSLFAVEDINQGEELTTENIKSIRPAHGLPPKFLDNLLGCTAAEDIEAGTPMDWELVAR